jgi:hypothetical protein
VCVCLWPLVRSLGRFRLSSLPCWPRVQAHPACISECLLLPKQLEGGKWSPACIGGDVGLLSVLAFSAARPASLRVRKSTGRQQGGRSGNFSENYSPGHWFPYPPRHAGAQISPPPHPIFCFNWCNVIKHNVREKNCPQNKNTLQKTSQSQPGLRFVPTVIGIRPPRHSSTRAAAGSSSGQQQRCLPSRPGRHPSGRGGERRAGGSSSTWGMRQGFPPSLLHAPPGPARPAPGRARRGATSGREQQHLGHEAGLPPSLLHAPPEPARPAPGRARRGATSGREQQHLGHEAVLPPEPAACSEGKCAAARAPYAATKFSPPAAANRNAT